MAGSSPAMTTDVSFRIVQAVQEFSTEGGVETVAFELAKAWDCAGVPNSVLASAVGSADGTNKKLERVAPWLTSILLAERCAILGVSCVGAPVYRGGDPGTQEASRRGHRQPWRQAGGRRAGGACG